MPHNKNKSNKRKFVRDARVTKTPGRQIIVRGKPVSPIRAATSIKGDDFHSDKNYVLREKFEFDIDKKENERNGAGVIISRENVDMWKLEIASARYVFDRDTTERFSDTKFTELTKAAKPDYGTPIVDQFEYENVTYHKADKGIAGARRLAYNIGETHVLSSWANGIIVFVCNAYNYIDKKGNKNRDLLQFTWYFSADTKRNFDTDVQNKVVGKGRKLVLNDVQRSTTGRYYCEVKNDKGTTNTIAHYVNVYRDGRIKEIMGGSDNDIPTGRFEWTPISTTKGYDKRHPKNRPYKDYFIEEEQWVQMRYNPQTRSFERQQARSGRGITKRPWNINPKIKWIKDNSMKGNTIQSNLQRKMGYWKYNNSPTVYWSDSNDVYSFPNANVYFDHREDMEYPRDFSDIEILNENSKNPYLIQGDNNIPVYNG